MTIALKPIHNVIIYSGHYSKNVQKVIGPYPTEVDRSVKMFHDLKRLYNRDWKVLSSHGEELFSRILEVKLEDTLVVIPAGESSELDRAFSHEECQKLVNCVKSGLNLFTTCGSAYWLAEQRIWNHQGIQNPETLPKRPGKVGLFPGVAIGPLTPYPGQDFSLSFYHTAVEITTLGSRLSVLQSGGGAFLTDAPIVKLATYSTQELQKRQKDQNWDAAVISFRCGKGKALLSMIHPSYGSEDIEEKALGDTFIGRDDDWRGISRSLSTFEKRMDFMIELLSDFETVTY